MKRIMRLVSMMFIRLLMVTLIVGCTNTSGGPNRQTNIDSGIQKESSAYTPISSMEYDGLQCVDVATMFYDAGFQNISITAMEEIITGNKHRDGDVYFIKVGDKVNFQLNDEFDPYTKVEIKYIVLVDSYGIANYEPLQIAQIVGNTSDIKETESQTQINSVGNNPNIQNSAEVATNETILTDRNSTDNETNTSENKTEIYSEALEVHFINVGQGDCTLIKCGTHAMLIDAGPDSKGTAIQLYLNKQNITKLDYILLTHYDEDHAGGADVILTKFNCDKVILPSYAQDNKTYRDVMDAMAYRNYTAIEVRTGDTYMIGGASFKVLSVGNNGDSNNNQSICIRVDYGNDSFLFTGDADESVEAKLINMGQYIDADVFQVGHHGSKDSNSASFISKVNPKYAVISCGADNSYGHPAAETLNNLRTNNVEVFRTDEQGSIIASTKGEGITWNTQPSSTWKAGEIKTETSNSSTDVIPTGGSINSNVQESLGSSSSNDSSDSTGKSKGDIIENGVIIYIEPDVDGTVWVPVKGGKKYHKKSTCSGMEDPVYVNVPHAEELGYTACKKCF